MCLYDPAGNCCATSVCHMAGFMICIQAVLNAPHRDALKYLPTDAVVTEDGQFRSPPKVNCYMGPHDRQTRVDFDMFDSVATCMYIPFVASRIMNHTAPKPSISEMARATSLTRDPRCGG